MRFIIILAIISISFCVLKSTSAHAVYADNEDFSDQEDTALVGLLFSKLSALSEGNEKLTKNIENLNERFENNVQLIITEIESLKKAVQNQNEFKNSKESLQEKLEETSSDEPPTENLISNSNSLKEKHNSRSWTVIQRRQDGSVDFNRNWDDYKTGFGNPNGEFFIGLDKIHELTNDSPNELLIILKDFYGNKKYAYYDNFLIGSEEEKYQLKSLGRYRGTAGDNLRNHLNMYFSTKDRDNDAGADESCAQWYQGAWWYYHCMTSNLNGPYRTSPYLYGIMRGIGITWGDYNEIQFAYKFSQMMIRPKRV